MPPAHPALQADAATEWGGSRYRPGTEVPERFLFFPSSELQFSLKVHRPSQPHFALS